MPAAWPADVRPASEAWMIENGDRRGGVSIVGGEQVVTNGAGRWRGRLTVQLIREEVLPLRRLVADLASAAGTVLVGPFDLIGAPEPVSEEQWALDLGLVTVDAEPSLPVSGPVTGTLALSAALRARTISITMPTNRRPRAGSYIGIGQRLHVLTSVTIPGSGSTYACTIEPGLREAALSGAAVYFTGMVCLMRLASPLPPDALTATGGDHVTNLTLDLVEVF